MTLADQGSARNLELIFVEVLVRFRKITQQLRERDQMPKQTNTKVKRTKIWVQHHQHTVLILSSLQQNPMRALEYFHKALDLQHTQAEQKEKIKVGKLKRQKDEAEAQVKSYGERMSELKIFAEDQVQKTNKTHRELKQLQSTFRELEDHYREEKKKCANWEGMFLRSKDQKRLSDIGSKNHNQRRLENRNENTNQFMPNRRASNIGGGGSGGGGGGGFQNEQQQNFYGDQQEPRQNNGQHQQGQQFERSNTSTSSYFNQSSATAVPSPFKRMMPETQGSENGGGNGSYARGFSP